MTRKKVKLVWIASDYARKACFKKRRLGLMKKVSELTTLCGIYAFVVVYGPDDDNPVIWPSRSAAQHLYRRFHSLPEVERQKKMMNQETYLKERTAKAQDLLKKTMKKNQELEIDILMNQLQQGRQICQFSTADLLGLFWMIEDKMRECRKRIEYHQQVNRLHPPPPLPPPGFVSSDSPLLQTGGNETDLVENGRSLVDQWFIDMVMEDANDKIGASGSSMAGRDQLGFIESEGNLDGLINGGANPMMITAEEDDDNLLSEWNFDGSGSGMSEIEKLVSSINGGGIEDDNNGSSRVDLSNQQGAYGIISGDGGSGEHMSLYSDGGGDQIGESDEAEMMLNGLFEMNGSSNENEDEDEDDELVSN